MEHAGPAKRMGGGGAKSQTFSRPCCFSLQIKKTLNYNFCHSFNVDHQKLALNHVSLSQIWGMVQQSRLVNIKAVHHGWNAWENFRFRPCSNASNNLCKTISQIAPLRVLLKLKINICCSDFADQACMELNCIIHEMNTTLLHHNFTNF